MIAYEPNFDDPSRTADYGFFANERMAAPVITGGDLADAIQSGVAPESAPFKKWVPKLLVGCQLDNEDVALIFKAMLGNSGTYSMAMDILNDVAYENYGE